MAVLKQYFGADLRELTKEGGILKDHVDSGVRSQVDNLLMEGFYHIDLEFSDDYSGLEWSGSEKTYGMVEFVNLLICIMKKSWPTFGLTGSMNAQGEQVEDRWVLKMVKGVATKFETPPTGTKIECPHCEESFYLEEVNE